MRRFEFSIPRATPADKDLRFDLLSVAHAQKGSEAEQTRIRILEIDKTAYSPDSPITNANLHALGNASCFLRLVTEKLGTQPRYIVIIMPELLPAVEYVAHNQAAFDADESNYGKFLGYREADSGFV
jgi:hypothetical protein